MRKALTATDVRRLTTFKRRYTLETAGFTKEEANYLLFTRWRLCQQHKSVTLWRRYETAGGDARGASPPPRSRYAT